MSSQKREQLPLPDYDQLPVGSLEHRIRSLGEDDLRKVLRYEQEHADRTPVEEMITSRLEQLERGSTPSPGGEQRVRPEQPEGTRRGSPVSPDTSPEPLHPPPHGTPGTRGKPKGDRPR